jgi:hypothetical protein
MREELKKFLKGAHWPKTGVPQDVKKVLAKNNACYVLITCGEPSEDGKMHVEMTYEGDACLAAYLIESAQNFIDDPEESS